MECGYALFDTALGRCGIAWAGSSIAGFQLPERDEGRAVARLKQRFPEFSPALLPMVATEAVAAVRQFLSGAIDTDLAAIPLDFDSVGAWEQSVYRAARNIPVGRTVTYGELALELGDVGKARAVGQALGRNPWPIVIPCHRITAASGAAGGFSAPGGTATKLKLLALEGALAIEKLPLFAAPSLA